LPDYYYDSAEDIREVRPFYWVLLVVLAFLYGWSVWRSPALQVIPRLAAFTGLMLIHAGLHWISPHLTTRRRWLLPYFIAQGGLAFAINLLAGNQGVTLGLYLALAGEAVGILENVRLSTIAVTGYLALSAINFGVMWGWATLPAWLVAIAPMTFFVIVYVAMFIRQAKARERAQALLRELEAAHRQLGDYAARVEELTLTNERQRMARELHDTLAQGLAGLILQLEAVDSHLGRGHAERAQTIAQQAMARARATLADARRAIGDLRAGESTPADLSEAVREEVQRFTTATGIPCALDLAAPSTIGDPLREHALRAVAEGLANVARHAHARQAWVRLTTDNGALEIVVCDDGQGFDPGAVSGQAGHYGLIGLRERARLAGGTLEMVSAPGTGTTLRLRLPQGSDQ
jgi:NarL family two-component system sensor histidine kinase YdfH